MSHPRIIGTDKANPALRLTQEQAYHAVWYQSERIRKMFLNSDIDYRNLYLESDVNRDDNSDQLNRRYRVALSKPAAANCFSKLLDLNMLVMTGGRERTWAEFAAMLTPPASGSQRSFRP